MNSLKKYTKKQLIVEILNSISHGVGAVMGIVFLILMCIKGIKTFSPQITASYAIYGSCFIFMFLASCVYHATIFTKLKNFFRIFDHSAIFFFIAGSYTPIIISILQGKERIVFLALIWAIALGGFLFKILTYGKYDKYIKLSVFLYILMGWIAIFLIKPMVLKTAPEFLFCIVTGGIIYTLGTYFYKKKDDIMNHLIWHFFVLAAAICQFIGIYVYL